MFISVCTYLSSVVADYEESWVFLGGVLTGKRKGYSLLHPLPVDYMRKMHKHERNFFF